MHTHDGLGVLSEFLFMAGIRQPATLRYILSCIYFFVITTKLKLFKAKRNSIYTVHIYVYIYYNIYYIYNLYIVQAYLEYNVGSVLFQTTSANQILQ